jgi:hypothetical protein
MKPLSTYTKVSESNKRPITEEIEGKTYYHLETWTKDYKPVPYSNATARETFEGGLRREKEIEGYVEELHRKVVKGWEWDPTGSWRVHSNVLEDLMRARRAGEEKEKGKEGEKEKEKEKEKAKEREGN